MGMIEFEKDRVFSELLEKTGNIGFTFDVNRKTFFSCTCGYSCNVSELKHLTVKTASVNGTEKEVTRKVCPSCGCMTIYNDVYASEDYIPVRYSYDVLQDDENFLVIGIRIEGVEIVEYKASYTNEDCDRFVVMYDRKERKFFVVSLKNLSIEQELGREKIFFPGMNDYVKGIFYDDSGEQIGVVAPVKYDKFNEDAIYDADVFVSSNSGLQDIYDLFNKETGLNLQVEEAVSLDDVLIDIFRNVNIGYIQSAEYQYGYIPGWIRGGGSFLKNFLFYSSLVEAGVDVKAKTISDAFGYDIKELCEIKSLNDYIEKKSLDAKIKAADLSEYHMMLLERLNRFLWKDIFYFAELFKKDVKTVIKNLAYAKGIEPEAAIRQLKHTISEHGEDWTREMVDFDSPISKSVFVKVKAIESKLLTAEQFDMLAKKPTLDYFYKTIIK